MSTEITFYNATSLSAEVFWINFDGEETKYATLGPYGAYTQSTYEGHKWVIRDALSGEKIGETSGDANAKDYEIGEGIKTAHTGDGVKVTFRNRSPVAAGVYWVDGTGKETLYASLRPGESYTQSTYAQHIWRSRSLHCGTEIAAYIASNAPEQTCEIDLETRQSQRPVIAIFTNRSPLHIEVVWLDDKGESVVYHRLAPGDTVEQPTFTSHPWLLRDAVSGTPIRVIPSLLHSNKIVEDAAHLHSLPGTVHSHTIFRNLCATRGKLMWVGFEGTEKEFATLNPGAEVAIDTFAGHPWRLRDASDGTELSLLVASPKIGQRRTFEPQPHDGEAVQNVSIANLALLTLDVGVEGNESTFYPLHRLGHGADVDLRVAEGREIVVRDVASHLVVRRIKGANTDLDVDIRPLDIRSQPLTKNVSVEMRNETPFDIDILWMDFEGNEKHYARLAPGQAYTQKTLKHHVWRARERFSRHLVGIYAASDGEAQSMAFTMHSLESANPIGIRFVNTTLLVADVYWMDYAGKEVHYATLHPGGSTGFRTFATHPWIVRDRQSRRVLDWSWGNQHDAVITLDDYDLKPREGEVGVKVTFANKLAWAVDVLWIDYQGKEKHYATVEPGKSVTIDTFETHPWRVRQAYSGDRIAMYIASADPVQTCDISLASVSGDVATKIEFANHSALTLEVFWLDYQGKEKKYATLEPRSSVVQETYMTHPWIVRDKVSGEPVGFTVGLREEQRLILTGAPTRSRDGGGKVSLTLKNDSGLRSDVLWIDQKGQEKNYGALDPGASMNITTFPAHAWRLREAEGGAEIDLYIVSKDAKQTHNIQNTLVRTSERPNAELWPGEVAFYEKPDFKGQVWILHADTPDCRRIAGMNDRVSSIRIGPNTAATVFRHVGYKGTNDVVYLDTPSLTESDVGDNQVSSIAVLSTPSLNASRFAATSRLTEDMDVKNGKIVKTPALRSIVTLPPLTGSVDVWATEELTIRGNGKAHVIDPVRPARLRANDTGKLEILMDPDAIGGGALMLRTPAMRERERVFVFPDADVHSKVLGMDDNALWRDRSKLGLDPSLTEQDAIHAGRALKSLSATVPAAHRSLSHGSSQDRLTITDRMSYDRWKLELGGTGKTLFRPAGKAELATAGALAIQVHDQAGQGFFDFLEDAASSVGNFFVETIPKSAETIVHETEEFFVEDVPGAMEDAGHAIVNTFEPIGRDIANTATMVWDDTVGWVERAAEDVAETVVEGGEAIGRSAKQFASDMTDAYDELSEDVLKGLEKAAKAVLRVTMEIGGKVYQFIADTVEIVGKVLRKVLDGIGIVLGKLVRVFMDLFDIAGVLDLHDAIIEKINGGIDFAEGAIGALKQQNATWLSGLQDEVVKGLDVAIDQLGGGKIARVNRDQPEDRSEAADKLDWLMSKLTDPGGGSGGGRETTDNPLMDRISGAMPGNTMAKLGGVIEPLVERLEAFIEGDFGIVLDAFGDSIALFRAALDQPSRAPDLILSGALSLVKALVVTGISLIELIADLLFDFFIAALELIKTALNTKLDIPFLAAFYEGMTGRELSAISLVAFVVAVPAAIIGQITLGRPLLSQSRAAQTLTAKETAIREEKQDWAVIYGVCHLCLNVFDLIYDISGAKIQKSKGDPNNVDTVEMHKLKIKVNRRTGTREIVGREVRSVSVPAPIPPTYVFPQPEATSGAGAAMSIAKLGIIGSVVLAQIAGNPTGSVNGLHPDEMYKALQGIPADGSDPTPAEAERTRYGAIVWSYQWLYLVTSVVDFGFSYSETMGGRGGGKVMEYGLPAATTIIGLVHLGLMSKFVNTDCYAEEWSSGGSDYRDEILERRRFSWLMDTFPAVTKVLAIPQLNAGTLYIPLGIHCICFVTLGHLGEAITYFERGKVEVKHKDFDL